MNLVAKEFVASRTDGDGVLVLSEFAGASWELPEAVQVNPYDVDGTAESCYRALMMGPEERRIRLGPLRARVQTYDVHRWATTFLEQLETVTRRWPTARRPPAGPSAARRALMERIGATEGLLALLDYDGTLVPYAATPELARPDPALLELLAALASRPRTEVHVVSGRGRKTLEHWLGALPIALHAEHGFWSRRPDGSDWVAITEVATAWRDPALAILRDITTRTPGSLIEVKEVALAWHYRMADEEAGPPGERATPPPGPAVEQSTGGDSGRTQGGGDPTLRGPQGPDRPRVAAGKARGYHRARDRRRSHRRRSLRRAGSRGNHDLGGPGRHPRALSPEGVPAVRSLLTSLVEAEVPR